MTGVGNRKSIWEHSENSMMHSGILSISYGWCLIARDGDTTTNKTQEMSMEQTVKILFTFRSLDFILKNSKKP